jgi:hypothetical protein
VPARSGPDAGSANPPAAGYSGTPLHRKLGIAPGSRVLVVGAPPGWDLGLLDPAGTASVRTRAGAHPNDVVMAFCPDQATLARRLPRLLTQVTQSGRLWLCWPKKSSGVATDLTENDVRRIGLAAGVVDVKVCAVDAIWSGLCFMTRIEDRG